MNVTVALSLVAEIRGSTMPTLMLLARRNSSRNACSGRPGQMRFNASILRDSTAALYRPSTSEIAASRCAASSAALGCAGVGAGAIVVVGGTVVVAIVVVGGAGVEGAALSADGVPPEP